MGYSLAIMFKLVYVILPYLRLYFSLDFYNYYILKFYRNQEKSLMSNTGGEQRN